MRTRNADLILVFVLSILNLVYAFFPIYHTTFIGVALALPLIFVLPGYAVTEVFFKRQTQTSSRFSSTDPIQARRILTTSDRFILSLGSSLAIAIGGGFLLNLLPLGLRATSWAAFLGLLTALLALLAIILRVQRQKGEPPEGQPVHPSRLTPRTLLLFWGAIVIALFSILYSVFSAGQQPHAGFTQFWLVPPSQSQHQCIVQLGVHSFEETPVTYRLNILINGKMVQTWATIALTPRQEWDQSVQITLNVKESAYIKAELYLSNKPEIVYRSVNVLLHSTDDGKGGNVGRCST